MLQFARWGFDYLKVDWCGGILTNLDPAVQYANTAAAGIVQREAATGHHRFIPFATGAEQPVDLGAGRRRSERRHLADEW